MAHYAKVLNGKVTQVIVAKADFFNTFVDSSPGAWIKTSYNTHGGIHYEPNVYPLTPSPSQEKSLRANYAGVGYTYDSVNDVFYAPKPEGNGWVIGPPTWIWVNTNPPPPPDPTGSFTVNVGTASTTITL
jgi:hypothetical protein